MYDRYNLADAYIQRSDVSPLNNYLVSSPCHGCRHQAVTLQRLRGTQSG